MLLVLLMHYSGNAYELASFLDISNIPKDLFCYS